MPDNYITIPSEQGSVNISEEVIAAIAAAAICEVDGVAGFSNTAVAELGELIGKKAATKGVRVSFENEAVRIDATIFAHYGTSIAAIGEKAQKAAAAAVESMTGLRSAVNIRIAGVAFDK